MSDDKQIVVLPSTPQPEIKSDQIFLEPTEDVLDKINNQQKFISKNYEFNWAKDNGFYTTEYTYWLKPAYNHRKLERVVRAERTKSTDQTYNRAWGWGYTEQIPTFQLNMHATLASMVVNSGTFVIDRMWWYTIYFKSNIGLNNMAGVRFYILNYTTGQKYYMDGRHKRADLWVVVDTEITLCQTREIYIDAPCELGPVIWYRWTTANGLPWSVVLKWDGGNPPVWHTDWGTTWAIKKEIEWWLFRDYNY